MSRPFPFSVFVAFALSTSAAQSHEFWIEPEVYMVAPGEKIVAAIRVGEAFEGTSYAYLPQNFRRFDLSIDDAIVPVPGRAGDRPALAMPVAKEGLAVVIHVTRDYELDYSSWEKFVGFVTSKDAEWVLDRHAERGLPEESPQEAYSRYGKSLVAVGAGAGDDRQFGLLTEIVALENPYTGDMSDGIDLQVFHDSQPRGNAQVEIFAKDADGGVEVTTAMTDKSGLVTIPVTPGRSYLVDAVTLREASPALADSMGAQWESLWASMTFAIPN